MIMELRKTLHWNCALPTLACVIMLSFNHASAYSSVFHNTMTKSVGTLFRHSKLVTKMSIVRYDADMDMMEMVAGGRRYEMVDLPDSMVDTTLFVGNLCEFVNDDMLSSLFQEASSLHSVPACVVRKSNMSSLKYGFVTFPTIQEKENAILRFSHQSLNGRRMKVEVVDLDNPRRSRVPEYFVAYSVGEMKPTRDGKTNTMRRRVQTQSGGDGKKKIAKGGTNARTARRKKTINWQ